ncbi:MAG: polyphosphate kinase [Thermoleophilaceae bacterium]|jgi:(p)ppGpp synthase/HD superfamily hydrolase|nr:polyphosphate kinase [Thermoleophilaceae bacterium]
MRFAADAYGSEAALEHPVEVAELVAGAGGDEELQRAAILHDVVEDTDVELGEIGAEFGSRVASIVSAMTEDESIDGYLERKKEHRTRACSAGREVALVFVADKLSNARRMRRAKKEVDALKLGHYGATLATMRAAYPDLPLLAELEQELDAVSVELQRSPS